MKNNEIISNAWQGKYLKVDILFSSAGQAHQITISNCRSGFHSNPDKLLFDCGDGTLRDLIDRKINPNDIDAIFITHGHFDHIGGLWSVLGFLRMIGRSSDLPIILPKGCAEPISIIEIFNKRYGSSIPFKINLIEADPNQSFEYAGMIVTTFAVSHSGSIAGSNILAPIPAFGYRIEIDGESVAISGDTGDCDSLRELVKDADLAIIEATFADSSNVTDEQLRQVHLSEDLAHEIGGLAKNYILVHKGRR